MRLVIDSSIFVSAFREGEKYSKEAFSVLENLERGTISAVIPVSVILEVVAAIRRRTGSVDLAKSVGEKLFSFPTISMIDIDTFRMTKFLQLAIASGLKGMDVLVVGVAQEFNLPILTLDQEMANIARQYVQIIDIKKVKKYL